MRRCILQTKFYLLSVLLSLASCSQDELAEQDTALPDGMYPMTFTAVQVAPENTPQTRVSDYDEGGEHKSKWTIGDKITVTVSKDGYTEKTTCTLDENGKITEYSPQLYWQTTENYDINAWYSNIAGQNTVTENTVSLADQSGGLAYVLKADPVTENYKKGNIALTFSHQLAKVRVKLEKGSYEGDFTVKVKGYTSCTVNNGEVSEGSGEGYITMCENGEYYEANLVPGTLQTLNVFEISTGEKTVQASLKENNVTLEKGTVHEITINVKQATLKPEGGKFTVNGGDNVLIKEYKGTDPIVVNGTATITLDNVQLNTTDNVMTINNGATVTLNVKGTDNVFTSTGGAGIKIMETTNSGQRGSITINGTSAGNSKLKVTAASGAAVGFRMAGDNVAIKYCGNIEINNITLETVGGNGSPAIGISAIESDGWDVQKTYGKISINGSTVTASSTGGAACIGTPYHDSSSPFTLEGISISNSTITTTAERNQAACIGFGYTAHVGKKIIGKIEFVNTTLSLTTGASNKVGFGEGNDSRELTEGIWNNGSKVGDTGWNPQ